MATPQTIRLRVNGEETTIPVDPHVTLAELLRDRFGLTGLKIGCDLGECGACTILLDGKPVLSCITLAVTADGCEIRTIEGVADGGTLDPVQRGILEHGGLQCGFCTPGMIMSVKGLLEENPSPDEPTVRRALAGNLCRCTGYQKIVDAVLQKDPAGNDHPKVDGVPQVTGAAQYTDDLSLPRMLHGKILRSPHPHARIVSIDVSKAERLEGVLAVMTGKDLPEKFGILPASQDETGQGRRGPGCRGRGNRRSDREGGALADRGPL